MIMLLVENFKELLRCWLFFCLTRAVVLVSSFSCRSEAMDCCSELEELEAQ